MAFLIFTPIIIGLVIGVLVAWFITPPLTLVCVLAALVGCFYFDRDSKRHNGNEASIINGLIIMVLGAFMVGSGITYGCCVTPGIWGEIWRWCAESSKFLLR